MAGSEMRPAQESLSIKPLLSITGGFSPRATNGPRTSNLEAPPTHGCVQKFEASYPREMIKLVVEGQITPQTSRSPSAAAMDDYSDIDVIL